MSLFSYFKPAAPLPSSLQSTVTQAPIRTACTGIRSPEATLYVSQHLLARKRGGLNPISEEPKLCRTIFPWRYNEDLSFLYSEEDLLKLTDNVAVVADIPEHLKSRIGEDLSAAERSVLDQYDRAKRFWIISKGIIYSSTCSTTALSPSNLCLPCAALLTNESFKRQMRKVSRSAKL